jgi:hypothetical protein
MVDTGGSERGSYVSVGTAALTFSTYKTHKEKDVVVVVAVAELRVRYLFFSWYCSFARCRKQATNVDSVHIQGNSTLMRIGVDQ